MFFRKLKHKILKIQQYLFRKVGGIEINWGYLIFLTICIVSIILLGSNIFRIIRKGYERYEIILKEKERLEELEQKNAHLYEELKYYSSKEFVDIKAREELNLAFPNQKLVYIEKKEPIELHESSEEKEQFVPSWRLWYELIF